MACSGSKVVCGRGSLLEPSKMADFNECPITADSSSNGACRPGRRHWLLVTLCVIASVAGRSGGSLLGRFYFDQGGQSYWLRTLLTSVGSPILLIPLLFNHRTQFSLLPTAVVKIKYLVACGLLGILVAGNNFLYSFGFYYLPVSTFSLLCATQLAFTAVFAFLLVKQRISHYVVNSLVLLILGTVLLGIQAQGERPRGISKGKYIWGIVCTILGSAVYGLIHPLLQLVFKTVIGRRNLAVVVETQALICTAAAVVSLVGLLSSGDFKHLKPEAGRFVAGRTEYCMTLVWSAVAWQICVLGTYGLVGLVSSLFSIVVSTVSLPIIPILAVFVFGDQLNALKVIGMLLGIWGFVSYAFGGYQDSVKAKVAAPAPIV